MCLRSAEPKLINSAGPSLSPCRAAQVHGATRAGVCSLLEDTLWLAALAVIITVIMIQNVLVAVPQINVEDTRAEQTKQTVLLQKPAEHTHSFCLVDDLHKFSVFRHSSKLGK